MSYYYGVRKSILVVAGIRLSESDDQLANDVSFVSTWTSPASSENIWINNSYKFLLVGADMCIRFFEHICV